MEMTLEQRAERLLQNMIGYRKKNQWRDEDKKMIVKEFEKMLNEQAVEKG